MTSEQISLIPLAGIGDVGAGDDLAALIGDAIERNLALMPGDIVAIAQKIVSKAEGRKVALAQVRPSGRAIELAQVTGKDARLVELVLSEAVEVMRAVPGVLVVRHRLGLVMANAGIDQSNIGPADAEPSALLLPLDPDASAERLRVALAARFGVAPTIVITDSFGRAWRHGTVNVAIGVAGMAALHNRRGEADRYGRILETTEVALGDAVAAAAGLAMGEGAEGRPVVVVRGLAVEAPAGDAASLIRPKAQDLFP